MEKSGPEIIIRRKVGISEAGHGAWKVAYADFVTAMMAFFLLLWILNVVTDSQAEGIASFFSPSRFADTETGLGHEFGGQSVSSTGGLLSDFVEPAVTSLDRSIGNEERGNRHGIQRESLDKTNLRNSAAEDSPPIKPAYDSSTNVVRQSIREALEEEKLQDSVVFETVEEGVRIQILDSDSRPMFEGNGTTLSRTAVGILRLIGNVLGDIPHPVQLIGFSADNLPGGLNPWQVSSERAIAALDVLADEGLEFERVFLVMGRGAARPFNIANPEHRSNNRLAIVIARAFPRAPVPGKLSEEVDTFRASELRRRIASPFTIVTEIPPPGIGVLKWKPAEPNQNIDLRGATDVPSIIGQ